MYINRANSYYNLRQLDEAEKDCFRALEINPDYSNPYLLLYFIYSSAGQKKKAAALGNTEAQRALNDLCIAYHPEAENLTAEKRAELQECLNLTFVQRDLSKGKRRSLNLINKGINDKFPYFCLAFIYEVEKNWKSCEEIAKAGQKFGDKDKQFLNLMAVAICNQGAHRIPEGLAYFEKGALAGDEVCAENYKIWKSVQNN